MAGNVFLSTRWWQQQYLLQTGSVNHALFLGNWTSESKSFSSSPTYSMRTCQTLHLLHFTLLKCQEAAGSSGHQLHCVRILEVMNQIQDFHDLMWWSQATGYRAVHSDSLPLAQCNWALPCAIVAPGAGKRARLICPRLVIRVHPDFSSVHSPEFLC